MSATVHTKVSTHPMPTPIVCTSIVLGSVKNKKSKWQIKSKIQVHYILLVDLFTLHLLIYLTTLTASIKSCSPSLALHKHALQCVIFICRLKELRSTSWALSFERICPWRIQKVLWVKLYLLHWLEKRNTKQTLGFNGLYRAVCLWECLSLPRACHHVHGGIQA